MQLPLVFAMSTESTAWARTNLGAATPIPVGGTSPLPDRPGKPEPDEPAAEDEAGPVEDAEEARGADPADAASAKAVNDAIAYIRSLAERRGRNADWSSASRSSSCFRLCEAAHGREVEVPGGSVTLDTQNLVLDRIEPDWRTRLLATVTNPTVAYLLLLIGIYGLLFEGYNPGAILPGVAGAICLLIAAYAFQILPVNYAGLALIALGIILMISEVFVPSFGVLGIGGIIAFVAGSVILMDTDIPGFGVPRTLIGSIGLLGGGVVMAIVWLAVRARRRPVVSGMEEMVGALAVAAADFDEHGQVLVHGEIWQAHSDVPVRKDQPLRVTAASGLTLSVEPAESKE